MKSLLHRISLVQGDITKVKADAIVNAANASLMGGGGVDGAIHRAGGPAIHEACKQIVASQGGCATGEAVITTAGSLPAKFVIHTVGPVWHGGRSHEPDKLASCYRSSMQLAADHQCHTIAFPNISTGVYGFPKDKAAAIAVQTILGFLANHDDPQHIILVCFDDDNFNLLKERLAVDQ